MRPVTQDRQDCGSIAIGEKRCDDHWSLDIWRDQVEADLGKS
jgi:hypothetical protein